MILLLSLQISDEETEALQASVTCPRVHDLPGVHDRTGIEIQADWPQVVFLMTLLTASTTLGLPSP